MKLVKKELNLEFCLSLIALILTISIFLKAIIDIDPAYDTWGYHLPFAARIWGIVPLEQFITERSRFDGFPLFVQFLQGFFWFITGKVQAANLVGFFSIVLYCWFLKAYWQIPIYYSAIALLAIPLVQTHATSCYVDLPANIFLAILILMTYLIYLKKDREADNLPNLIIIILSAAAAANAKPQLIPLVFLVLCFAGSRLLWLRWRKINKEKGSPVRLIAFFLSLCLASILIFATPIKNIALYGNPFYPVRIEIAGKVLNHTLPLYNAAPGYLGNAPRAQRWLYSILDIKAAPWSIDQWSENPDSNRMGGFFGSYVLFHLVLFGYISLFNRDRETSIAAIVLVVMSLVAANFPQSHELRYFMYWMIVLVSLNLYFVTSKNRFSPQKDIQKLKQKTFLKPYHLGLACLLALTIVTIKTQFFYIKPSFYSLSQHIQKHIDYGVISAIQPGDEICLIGKYPYTFLYAPVFHPYLNYDYSIKKAGNPTKCEGHTKILGYYPQ
ncbi:MAG: hypothetical protein QNJ34_16295 [Xenococcaceae cyanobacterium MO_188.B29]|nr:hypothetical protein [Xenococcaceae cyanobacterium MO_188.B29]